MLIILGIIVAALSLYLALKAKAPLDIYKQFSLPATQWVIVGTDLGKGHPRKRLSALGVAGEPDAIFRGNRTGQIVIGEFKNRMYKGFVRRREYVTGQQTHLSDPTAKGDGVHLFKWTPLLAF